MHPHPQGRAHERARAALIRWPALAPVSSQCRGRGGRGCCWCRTSTTPTVSEPMAAPERSRARTMQRNWPRGRPTRSSCCRLLVTLWPCSTACCRQRASCCSNVATCVGVAERERYARAVLCQLGRTFMSVEPGGRCHSPAWRPPSHCALRSADTSASVCVALACQHAPTSPATAVQFPVNSLARRG
jgi:hypothetical protein